MTVQIATSACFQNTPTGQSSSIAGSSRPPSEDEPGLGARRTIPFPESDMPKFDPRWQAALDGLCERVMQIRSAVGER